MIKHENGTASVFSCERNVEGTVTIPSSISVGGISYTVTTIGVRAFAGCRSLKSINIPDSVSSIGCSAFWGCKSLSKIYFQSQFPPEVGDSILFGYSVFNGCPSDMIIYHPEDAEANWSTKWQGLATAPWDPDSSPLQWNLYHYPEESQSFLSQHGRIILKPGGFGRLNSPSH